MQQIFRYPYIIITIFVFFVLIMALIAIYFAIRGMKTANGKDENDFTNVNKIENHYDRLGKTRADRCVIYISLSLDKLRGLYTETEGKRLLYNIKNTLLETFSIDVDCMISGYGEKDYVVLAKWDMDTTRANMEKCQSELNKCLINHNALNVVDLRMGSFFAYGTQVTFDEAIARAKQASMLAQSENKMYVEWNAYSGKALEKKIKIENNIEREIDNNRFFLEYQPVLDAHTKSIVGAEVLSRLNSESDGILSPGSFLSAVDSVGIHQKFDYYIFEKNCKWIANDKTQREQYRYAINFSRATLCAPDFASTIISIVEKYDLQYRCLAVEILEDKDIVGDARKLMLENLTALKEKGMLILLDDFGNGHTTFGDLQNIDISTVKIDKTITQNAITEAGFIILKNIIRTSKEIGFKTLCEGIETKEHEEAAIKAGCDMLQGYYYYRPMPVAQLEKVFEQHKGQV